MQAAVETVQPPLFRRHARRPRLTRLLDESRAQAIVITGPAGYGKTTLATEWLQGREDVFWYRATSASADVAAFSAGLADLISSLLPGTGDRLKQRLRVADTPERAARPLAELLAEDLAEWPESALLVIDDYHLVADSAPVEDFFDWLLTLAAQLRVLVTSRRRPRWASARRILYGEIAEIGRDQLAMNAEEAGRALGDDRSSESVRALVTQAEGWPALIGLAALTASREIPGERVSEALYRYFAEEVVRREAPDVQRFMLLASVPATVDARIAREVLGIEDPEPTLAGLVEEGLLHPAGEQLRFHPLLRSFLRQRLEASAPEMYFELTGRAISHSRETECWEDAFELAFQAQQLDLAVAILVDATANMLASGRIETLERWFHECGPAAIRTPGAILAKVEILIRKGQLADAAAIAKELASRLTSADQYTSRAYFLAGQALYLGSGSQQAVQFHRRARESANDADDLKHALWGLFMTENELGLASADQHLAELEAMASQDNDLDTRLRVAVGRQAAGARRGSFAGLWETASPLIPLASHATDPMARTTLFANGSYLCVAHADYARGAALASTALNECKRLGFDFAKGYCLATLTLAHAGLRAFRSAHQSLRELAAVAEEQDNQYLRCTAEITFMRVALARGRPHEAIDGHDPNFAEHIPVPAAQGEYLGVLALAAAATGDGSLATSCAQAARRLTTAIEARFFSAFADLVVLQAADTEKARREASRLAADVVDAVFEDALVLAYRTHPPILELLPQEGPSASNIASVMNRANDQSAASVERRSTASAGRDLMVPLTPREHEVLALLASGLSNAEIAERLFISLSTAKVHVQHILKKLGAKTRLQAAMQAQSRLGNWD
jgi:ATP/maltotriose-dependent transcriptional regulator MalT